MSVGWLVLGGVCLISLLVYWLVRRSERIGKAKVLEQISESEEEKRARLADLPASSKPDIVDRLRKGGF